MLDAISLPCGGGLQCDEVRVEYGMLVASPQMIDPFFGRAVIMMCEHSSSGSMGLIINRPLSVTFDSVLDQLKVAHDQTLSGQVLWGGPVMPEAGFMISRGPIADPPPEVMRINENILVSSSKVMLEKAAAGDVPPPYYLCLGYAGWGAGQLDSEIQRGTWIVLDLDEEVIFSTPLDDRWDTALASLGIGTHQIWMNNPVDE